MKEFTRVCPRCSNEIKHKTKASRDCSQKAGRPCQSCGAKARLAKHGNNAGFLAYCTSEATKGENNPFFGKKHTEATKEKVRNRDKSFFATDEYRQKQSKNSSGSNNPMFGKTVYQVWLEKYGKDEADDRLEKFKQKQRKGSSGENNPMFGKPSPNGSGNGWSGWYGDFYFRSLRELSYVVRLDADQIPWTSIEDMRIDYVFNGGRRTYHPDFLVEGCRMVEIKPFRLHDTPLVIAKHQAAEAFCRARDWTYELIDPELLREEEFKVLCDEGRVRFSGRYQKMFEERLRTL